MSNLDKSELHILAEKSFGYSISQEEFKEAEFLARNKLQHILRNEGSDCGIRLTLKYLAELIAEHVQFSRFQVFVTDQSYLIEEKRKRALPQ